MNADTKKKIEDAAILYWKHEGNNPISDYKHGARFGYQLALKDAEVLVDAMVDIRSECTMPNPTSTPEYVINRVCEALEQWHKVTEEK